MSFSEEVQCNRGMLQALKSNENVVHGLKTDLGCLGVDRAALLRTFLPLVVRKQCLDVVLCACAPRAGSA